MDEVVKQSWVLSGVAIALLVAMLVAPFVAYFIGVSDSDRLLIDNGQILVFKRMDEGYCFDGVCLRKEQTEFSVPSEFKGKPIIEIDAECFFGESNLKHIIVPEGVRRIDDYAMAENKTLEKIDLPNSLESIASSAFQLSGDIIINYGGSQEMWESIYQKNWLTGELTINYMRE